MLCHSIVFLEIFCWFSQFYWAKIYYLKFCVKCILELFAILCIIKIKINKYNLKCKHFINEIIMNL